LRGGDHTMGAYHRLTQVMVVPYPHRAILSEVGRAPSREGTRPQPTHTEKAPSCQGDMKQYIAERTPSRQEYEEKHDFSCCYGSACVEGPIVLRKTDICSRHLAPTDTLLCTGRQRYQ
jgi:hypothetical protein